MKELLLRIGKRLGWMSILDGRMILSKEEELILSRFYRATLTPPTAWQKRVIAETDEWVRQGRKATIRKQRERQGLKV